MGKNINMTQGPSGKQILLFALPMMLGNVFQQLYTVVDTAIVGKGVGMAALAALGTVDWLNWMYLGIVQGFAQGFSVLMAQKFGEGDENGLKHAVGNSARLSIYIGGITLFLGQVCLPLFLNLLKVPDELRPMAVHYSRIIMLGIPAAMLFNFAAGTLRAVGDSRTPLYAVAIASVTNIVLDCLAVFVLDLGITGAAVATVFSQCLSSVICVTKIYRSQIVCFNRTHMKPNIRLTGRLMMLGFPVTMQNIVISVGGMAVTAVVNRFDTTFIAGFVATNKLYGVLEIAALSYGHAVTTFVGQNFGAEKWDRIRSGVNKAVAISLVTSAVIGSLMLTFGRDITMLFISTESVTAATAAGETAYRYLSFMAVMLPVLYLLYVYRSALQGMGNTVIPLVSGMIEFVIRVGCSAVISFTLWRDGIFCAEVGAWLGAAIILAVSYYRNINIVIKNRS